MTKLFTCTSPQPNSNHYRLPIDFITKQGL